MLNNDPTLSKFLSSLTLMLDNNLNTVIRLLNEQQKCVFNRGRGWAKSCIITLPFLFISGNAGIGESFLMNFIYQAVTSTLSRKNALFDKPNVSLMTRKELSVINIEETIIHTCFNTPIGHFRANLQPL